MTTEQIKICLCVYDERHPDYDPDMDKVRIKCYCDNCHYGRTKLANELLNAINFIDEFDLTASWEKNKT